MSLVYGTSAGLIAFSHFETADIPVTTWMLAAFYFAQNVLLRGRLADYMGTRQRVRQTGRDRAPQCGFRSRPA